MKNITPEMVAPNLSNAEIKWLFGISEPTIAKYRKIYGICIRKRGQNTLTRIQIEKRIPCPRCGAKNWKAVSETVMYCRQPTPGEEFKRCFYHTDIDKS